MTEGESRKRGGAELMGARAPSPAYFPGLNSLMRVPGGRAS